MHIQSGVPNWTTALPHMPDGGLVLGVDNGDALVAAKHANPKLITALRHFVPDQQFPDTYAAAADSARHYFASFIDGTYLDRYLPYVDLIVEFNEYYDQGMAANDPDVLALRLLHATAFAHVWNDEWRGKVVPASVRLVIGNSPVGNDIPVAFAKLAISTDNVLGYHPYQHASLVQWPTTLRDPGDWRYHSGRWHFQEQAWGLKPRWCFTETMPYMGSSEGWRHAICLQARQDLLVQVFRGWLSDVATTPAYREGRILGTGAWFTIGGNWYDYLLEAPQLVALADAAHELWHPGTGETIDMDAQNKLAIAGHANDILALCWLDGKTVPFDIPSVNRPLQFYHQDGSPFVPAKILTVTWVMKVTAISGAMLQVLDREGTDNDLWVRARDVMPSSA